MFGKRKGADDKMRHSAEKFTGAAKEKMGSAAGNESMENEGRRQQAVADLKKGGDKVADTARDIKDDVTDD